jgi:hypothetical protein
MFLMVWFENPEVYLENEIKLMLRYLYLTNLMTPILDPAYITKVYRNIKSEDSIFWLVPALGQKLAIPEVFPAHPQALLIDLLDLLGLLHFIQLLPPL